MNQQTTDTARKAIRFFQGQLGAHRITGGPLPGNAGLVVGIKSEPEGSGTATDSYTPHQNGPHHNGNGSASANGSPTTLDALLVVANRDEDDPPLVEALRDGERIGPAKDVVGENTRHAILSWREDQIEPDGSMSESYVVSVAATLIQSPPSDSALSAREDHERPANRQADDLDPAGSSVAAEGATETTSNQDEAGSAVHDESERETEHARPSEPHSPDINQDNHSHAETSVSQQHRDPGCDSSQPAVTSAEQQSTNDSPDQQDEAVAEQGTDDVEDEAHVSTLEPSRHNAPDEMHAEPQPVEEPKAPDQPDDGPNGAALAEVDKLPRTETEDKQPPDAQGAEYEVDTPDLDNPADEEDLYGSAHQDAPGTGEDSTPASEQDTRELEPPVKPDPSELQDGAAHSTPPEQPGSQAGAEPSQEGPHEAARTARDSRPAEQQSEEPHTPTPTTRDAGDGDGHDQARAADSRQQAMHTANTEDDPPASYQEHYTAVGDGPDSHSPQNRADHQPDSQPGTPPAEPDESGAGADKLYYPDGQPPGDPEPAAPPEAPRPPDGGEDNTAAGPRAESGKEDADLEDPHSGWLEGLVSGTTPTPEWRAYCIGQKKAARLSAKLTFKKPPDPPPRLTSVNPAPEQAIERIAASPRGPGIVMPMTSKGGAGKTIAAVEIAFMLGMVGGAYSSDVGGRTARVLLVDMNINNPDLSERIRVDGAGRMGLKDLLNGEHISRVVNRTALPNVDTLFLLGKEDYDKGDLPAIFCDERGMEAIIEAVAGGGGYDFVVVDTSNTFPGEAYSPASYSLTMWAAAADARYLMVQPEIASFVNAARFAVRLGAVIGDEASTVPILNRMPVKKVYEEAQITKKMGENRRDAMKALKRLQDADGYPVVPAVDGRGDPLKYPLFLPDYPEEVHGFMSEGRPLCMYSQIFADVYYRVATDAVRRIYDNRKPN